jgi:hypothetical protein
MTGRSSLRRLVAAASASAIVSAFTLVGGVAQAAALGPYSGFAHASAVHIDAATSGTTRLANIDSGVANASVDSEGLEQTLNAFSRPLVDAAKLGSNSYAMSQLLEAGLATAPDGKGQIIPQAPLVVGAPDSEALSHEVFKNTTSTIANALVVKRTAAAVWNADTCVLGEPISQGTFEAAMVELVDSGADADTANFDKELVGVVADSGGPDRDAVNEVSLTQLYDGSGVGFGLMAATMSTIAPVTLFEGTTNETTIEILGPATLRTMADGTSGGATVTFAAPAVSIIQNGVRQVILPDSAGGPSVQLPGPDGAVLDVTVGKLDVSQKAGNGTSASAKGSVVTVDVLQGPPAPAGSKGATISIGHVEAAVAVPAGGILCPLRVEVDADPPSVGAGKTVDVTTTVFNDFNCPLTAVELVDTLTTEGDATFTITEAPLALRKSAGTGLRTGSVEWLIPSIAAHGSAARVFTMRLDTGPGRVNIDAVADGKLSNCPVKPGGDSTTVSGLGSANALVGGSADVTVPVSFVKGGGVVPGPDLPPTGVGSAAAAGIAMLTMAGGLFASRRRTLG